MQNLEERPVYVIGHRHPDTDSICAAITYANLKNEITDGNYKACRAGDLNEETRYVLRKFGVEEPLYIEDVRPQVHDMEIREIDGVGKGESLKTAWKLMTDANVVTLPVTEGDELTGLITMDDIVDSYMDTYDANILSLAKTSYQNIVETLDGKMVVGDIDAQVERGKILIAAGSPELMEHYIQQDDIVILGNRYEMQLCAIEMNAGGIIVCEGADIASTIQKQAENHGCKIISTPHDTFTVARLINQSLPISYFMRSRKLVTFHLDDFTEDVQAVMAKERHRYFPVLDESERFAGMISRRNFLGAQKKQVILVDHNEKSQAVKGLESADILEIIDHHRLGTVETMGPVFFRNQPLGSTSTIIYKMYMENQVKIDKTTAGLLLAAIISDTLLYRSPTCTEEDKKAGKMLSEIAGIDDEAFALEIFRAGSNLSSKTPGEIIRQDFKRFSVNDLTVGIGQINSMDAEELKELEKRVEPVLQGELANAKNLDMIFLLFTNILKESSEVLFAGNNAEEVLEDAFGNKRAEDGSICLDGVVSRKKQFLPALVEALQQR